MGFVFIEICVIIILLVCLWIAWNYILLIIAKRNVDKEFSQLFEMLKEYYALIRMYLEENQNCIQEQALVEQTYQYIDKATNFSIEKDGNERIIAYANSIINNLQLIQSSTNTPDNSIDNSNILKFQDKFNKVKETYNKSAIKLRHYADVFPTSLLARFKKIFIVDYMN